MAKHRKAFRLNPRNDLTAEYVRSALTYDKKTGLFTWGRGRRFAGRVAGSIDRRGYNKILLNGHSYTAGRLAWLYVTGSWPINEIDHRNRIRSDNRWKNLRDATIGLNGRNSTVRKDSLSRVKNVRKHTSGRWIARIRWDGRMQHIGMFATKREAGAAVGKEAKSLFGKFYNQR